AGADNKYIAFHWITPQCSDMSSAVSGQTVDVVVKGKIAHDAHGAIGFFHGNRRHIDAVEPILLDHGVARGITNGYTIPDLQRRLEAAFAKNVACQAGLAADHVFMLTGAVAQR